MRTRTLAALSLMISPIACGRAPPSVAEDTAAPAPPAPAMTTTSAPADAEPSVTTPTPVASATPPASDSAPSVVALDTADATTVPPEPDAVMVVEPGVVAAPGWCVVLGNGPIDALERVSRIAAKARELFPQAAVYDARDFDTFTWGDLVVVGEIVADEASALARVAEAKSAKLSAFSKRCDGAGARPITSAADIAPPFAAPSAPYVLPEADIVSMTGCFAWSMKERHVFCAHEQHSIQGGGSVAIERLPSNDTSSKFVRIVLAQWEAMTFDDLPEPKLVGADRRRLAAALKAGAYVALGETPWLRPLSPGGILRWSEPAVSLTWKRKSVRQVEPMAGSWSDFTDTFEVRCGEQTLVAWQIETHDEEPRVAVGLIPGGNALMLGWADVWGIEGDMGGSTLGDIFDLGACDVAKPATP